MVGGGRNTASQLPPHNHEAGSCCSQQQLFLPHLTPSPPCLWTTHFQRGGTWAGKRTIPPSYHLTWLVEFYPLAPSWKKKKLHPVSQTKNYRKSMEEKRKAKRSNPNVPDCHRWKIKVTEAKTNTCQLEGRRLYTLKFYSTFLSCISPLALCFLCSSRGR